MLHGVEPRRAQPGARANAYSCHVPCFRTARASYSRGSSLTLGRKQMTPDKSTTSQKRGIKASAETKSVKLLTGGNPQIPKGDGDAPVQAYIAAMPGWKSRVGQSLDALIVSQLPNVQKAVRWNSPFYGTKSQGWLVSFHVLTRCVQLNFFCGSLLDPIPPGSGKDPKARWLNIHENDRLDEVLIKNWLKQSSELKGWASFSA